MSLWIAPTPAVLCEGPNLPSPSWEERLLVAIHNYFCLSTQAISFLVPSKSPSLKERQIVTFAPFDLRRERVWTCIKLLSWSFLLPLTLCMGILYLFLRRPYTFRQLEYQPLAPQTIETLLRAGFLTQNGVLCAKYFLNYAKAIDTGPDAIKQVSVEKPVLYTPPSYPHRFPPSDDTLVFIKELGYMVLKPLPLDEHLNPRRPKRASPTWDCREWAETAPLMDLLNRELWQRALRTQNLEIFHALKDAIGIDGSNELSRSQEISKGIGFPANPDPGKFHFFLKNVKKICHVEELVQALFSLAPDRRKPFLTEGRAVITLDTLTHTVLRADRAYLDARIEALLLVKKRDTGQLENDLILEPYNLAKSIIQDWVLDQLVNDLDTISPTDLPLWLSAVKEFNEEDQPFSGYGKGRSYGFTARLDLLVDICIRQKDLSLSLLLKDDIQSSQLFSKFPDLKKKQMNTLVKRIITEWQGDTDKLVKTLCHLLTDLKIPFTGDDIIGETPDATSDVKDYNLRKNLLNQVNAYLSILGKPLLTLSKPTPSLPG